MTRYVIGPDVAIHLAGEEAVIPDGHDMLAPALLRSQMLSLLYQAVHRGEMTKEDAERRLFYARGMRIRLHEDHELQNAAWNVADQLGSGRDAAVWRLGCRWTGNSAADHWRARRPVTGGRS
jgi:hypothetical protein